ncbi:hypothetical protein [Halalkalibacter nanhaiisediminis]|uniref:hypothetical protein n=1 Tax=Halalkalibacter nanhaiisediminis TaxID=688079 RepID=UPI0011A08528|nr:hypothetical protein [Halalkalibacter nanhaiisediminis]
MSIIYFPRRMMKKVKVNTKDKIIMQSNAKPFVNHQYIQEVMNEHGYKRENDVLLQTLKKFGIKV